jgi:hypothetical protein
MPILRYFLFTGSVLLALLFAADRYLPPPVDRAEASDLDKTVIRIRSARTLPEKIVFDTNSPTVAPPSVALAEQHLDERPRDAYAMTAEPVAQHVQQQPAAQPKPTRTVSRQRTPHLHRAGRPQRDPRLAFEHHETFGAWW